MTAARVMPLTAQRWSSVTPPSPELGPTFGPHVLSHTERVIARSRAEAEGVSPDDRAIKDTIVASEAPVLVCLLHVGVTVHLVQAVDCSLHKALEVGSRKAGDHR
jgi:hypothetical protein